MRLTTEEYLNLKYDKYYKTFPYTAAFLGIMCNATVSTIVKNQYNYYYYHHNGISQMAEGFLSHVHTRLGKNTFIVTILSSFITFSRQYLFAHDIPIEKLEQYCKTFFNYIQRYRLRILLKHVFNNGNPMYIAGQMFWSIDSFS